MTINDHEKIRGKASVALYARDGKIWLNQQQMAELFATSKPNISMHIANILKEKELTEVSVVKNFLTTCDRDEVNPESWTQLKGSLQYMTYTSVDGSKYSYISLSFQNILFCKACKAK